MNLSIWIVSINEIKTWNHTNMITKNERQLKKKTSRACEIALTWYVHEISPGRTKRMRQRKFLNIKVQVLTKISKRYSKEDPKVSKAIKQNKQGSGGVGAIDALWSKH